MGMLKDYMTLNYNCPAGYYSIKSEIKQAFRKSAKASL